MSYEGTPVPADLPEIRQPNAELSELRKIQAFNIAMWKETYKDPSQPQITDEWIEEYLTRIPSIELPMSAVEAIETGFTEAYLDNPNEFWRIAVDDQGEVVGLMRAFKKTYDEDRPKAGQDCTHLEALFIHPDHQGKGLGRKFMDDLDEWRDRALDLELEVATYTPQAQAVYTRRGYIEEPNSHHHFAEKIPMIYMVLEGANNEV